MRLLLDTNIFFWIFLSPSRLIEDLTLLSSDIIFAQYSVKFIDSKTYKI